MKFNVWFTLWITSFLKLLTVGSKKRKSDAQRKKDRARRLKAKFSGATAYRSKKKYRKRRSSHHVENERLMGAMFKFAAISLGVLLLPFGLVDWGYKSAKARRGSRAAKKSSQISDTVKTSGVSKQSTSTLSKARSIRTASARNTTNASETQRDTENSSRRSYSQFSLFDQAQVTHRVPPPSSEADEHTPKSTPKNGKQSESDKLDTKAVKKHNLTLSRNIVQISQQSLLDYQNTYMCLGKRRRVVKPAPENSTSDTTV